jgi:TetR/AcrR family transcriptional regulator, regulator of autoinduction and epiphytic fitness
MSIPRFAAPRFGAGLDDILHVVTLNADSTDHRSQGRRNRNSEAVLEAVLSLFLEHNLHPHPKEIADRAGVSLRSVYRYLGDADLMRVGMDQIIQRQREDFRIDNLGAGPLEDRIAALVQTRVRGVRTNADVIAAADHFARSRPDIDTHFRERRHLLRKQVAAQFAPELKNRGAKGEIVLDAVDALTQIEAITYHLDDLGHSDTQTIRRLQAALIALLNM